MTVLSFDPSFLAYGYAAIEDGKLKLCGRINLPKREVGELLSDYDTRCLKAIGDELQEHINVYKPDAIYLEHPVGSKSSRAAQTLGYVKGLTLGICIANSIQYTTIKAITVKMKLTGRRNASKADIISAVSDEFPNFVVLTKGWTQTDREAASDAAAVYLGIKKLEVKKS